MRHDAVLESRARDERRRDGTPDVRHLGFAGRLRRRAGRDLAGAARQGRRGAARVGFRPQDLARAPRARGRRDRPSPTSSSEGLAATGAVVMGRKMFSGGSGPWEDDPNADGWWGDEPPFRVPVFVLTHHARERVESRAGRASRSSPTASSPRSSRRARRRATRTSTSRAGRRSSSSTSRPGSSTVPAPHRAGVPRRRRAPVRRPRRRPAEGRGDASRRVAAGDARDLPGRQVRNGASAPAMASRYSGPS